MSPAPDPVPAPDPTPRLSPEAWRVLLVGGALFVLLIGLDVALEMTGHGGSAVASLITKSLATVVALATTYLTGRSPGPQQASMAKKIAHLERKLADSTPPTGTQV